MRQAFILALTVLLPGVLQAQSLIANRAIPSRSVISPIDVTVSEVSIPGAYSRVEDVIGQEARVTIYPGRPLRMGDVGPPAIIERNQVVTLRFTASALSIEVDGRALDRAGVGDALRVMNLASRTIVSGRVAENGTVEVGR